jgi:hypothetical protein
MFGRAFFQHFRVSAFRFRIFSRAAFHPQTIFLERETTMRLRDKIKQAGATGWILLWLIGIPLPILLILFLLRGCT